MTKAEFMKAARNYKQEDLAGFGPIVKGAQSLGVSKIDLADAFAVSPATIDRWSRSGVVPGPAVRTRCAGIIADMVSKAAPQPK